MKLNRKKKSPIVAEMEKLRREFEDFKQLSDDMMRDIDHRLRLLCELAEQNRTGEDTFLPDSSLLEVSDDLYADDFDDQYTAGDHLLGEPSTPPPPITVIPVEPFLHRQARKCANLRFRPVRRRYLLLPRLLRLWIMNLIVNVYLLIWERKHQSSIFPGR